MKSFHPRDHGAAQRKIPLWVFVHSVVRGLSWRGIAALSSMLLISMFLIRAQAAVAQDQNRQEILAQADKILQQMSQITGLPIKSPVKKQIINRKEIEKYLVENIHEETKPEELHAQEALVRALGLVPQDFNLEKFLINFYTEQAAGLYDPKRKTMFIADWSPADTQDLILSHELTHALQDQSWDLEAYLHGARDDDDATDARQAVVEGEATVAMLQRMTGALGITGLPSLSDLMDEVVHQQFDEFPAYSHAPYFFRMQATFPYVQGAGFIQTGLEADGWKSLSALFEHPPENTKQIFDPKTYFDHQEFPKIKLPHPRALEGNPGLRFLHGNTLGELGYYSLLGQLDSDDEAKSLSPAWVADQYLLYERTDGKGYTLVARVQWASAEAAHQFFRDYSAILTHRFPGLVADKRSSDEELIGSTAEGTVLILLKGSECRWAQGVPAEQADALLEWLRAL